MITIYAIRHGKASFGASDYDRLSSPGIRQSELLGDYLNAVGIHFDMVVTGRHRRQRETAAHVARRMPGMPTPTVMPEFDEFDTDAILSLVSDKTGRIGFSGAAPPSLPSFKSAMETALARALATPECLAPEHRLDRFIQRAGAGISKLVGDLPEGGTIGVFTSGGTMAAFMQIALNIHIAETIRLPWQIFNTAFSTFIHDGVRLELQSFNTLPHLAQPGREDMITLL